MTQMPPWLDPGRDSLLTVGGALFTDTVRLRLIDSLLHFGVLPLHGEHVEQALARPRPVFALLAFRASIRLGLQDEILVAHHLSGALWAPGPDLHASPCILLVDSLADDQVMLPATSACAPSPDALTSHSERVFHRWAAFFDGLVLHDARSAHARLQLTAEDARWDVVRARQDALGR